MLYKNVLHECFKQPNPVKHTRATGFGKNIARTGGPLIVHVRDALEYDSRDIFEWRNDRLTREMSLSTDPVDWSTHQQWFSNSLISNERVLFICETEESSSKIGIVRFDMSRESAVVSINISTEMRGKGYAKQCLLQSIERFQYRFRHVSTLNAEIRMKNRASAKIFRSVGFTLLREEHDIQHYHLRLSGF